MMTGKFRVMGILGRVSMALDSFFFLGVSF